MVIEKLNNEQRNEIVSLCRDPKNSYEEIAALYGVTSHYVSQLARKNGIDRRPRKNKTQAESFSAQQELIEKEIEAAKARLQELEAKKKELEIGFECDTDGQVMLYGINKTPIVAHYKDLVRWLKSNGAVKLREYIQVQFRA